jgi:hypothetical protein
VLESVADEFVAPPVETRELPVEPAATERPEASSQPDADETKMPAFSTPEGAIADAPPVEATITVPVPVAIETETIATPVVAAEATIDAPPPLVEPAEPVAEATEPTAPIPPLSPEPGAEDKPAG